MVYIAHIYMRTDSHGKLYFLTFNEAYNKGLQFDTTASERLKNLWTYTKGSIKNAGYSSLIIRDTKCALKHILCDADALFYWLLIS